MNLVTLDALFEISYGNSFDLNVLECCDSNSFEKVNYVSRTRENNGVSAFVKRIEDTEPFEKGLITVAGSGNSVLESFIQPEPFYTGYHVFILRPKVKMTEIEKLFYCYCIRMNQYKYSFGRQANKTLKCLLVPEKMIEKFNALNINNFQAPKKDNLINHNYILDIQNWKWFDVDALFYITASSDDLISNYSVGNETPYITSSELNNGVSSHVESPPTNKGNVITANRGGSVGHFFYQDKGFIATPVDVRILTPKFKLNKYIGLFIVTIMKLEKPKYNYSRKMGTGKLKKMKVRLPAKNNSPDYDFMENYIKSLPYSVSL